MNNREREDALTLQILEAVEAESDLTQRHLARRTGIALGLANGYLKRCVRKGLLKVHQAPANRYLYYLTPKGFVEKTRLTTRYLSHSLGFYRRASQSCRAVLTRCELEGWRRVMLCGAGDLAEIAALHAHDIDIDIVAVLDAGVAEESFLRFPVLRSTRAADADAWVIADLLDPQALLDQLSARLPEGRVLVPDVVGIKTSG